MAASDGAGQLSATSKDLSFRTKQGLIRRYERVTCTACQTKRVKCSRVINKQQLPCDCCIKSGKECIQREYTKRLGRKPGSRNKEKRKASAISQPVGVAEEPTSSTPFTNSSSVEASATAYGELSHDASLQYPTDTFGPSDNYNSLAAHNPYGLPNAYTPSNAYTRFDGHVSSDRSDPTVLLNSFNVSNNSTFASGIKNASKGSPLRIPELVHDASTFVTRPSDPPSTLLNIESADMHSVQPTIGFLDPLITADVYSRF